MDVVPLHSSLSLSSGWCPQDGVTALMEASLRENLEVAKLLVAAKAEINARTNVSV